jgi:CheY-like chemotaxis protein
MTVGRSPASSPEVAGAGAGSDGAVTEPRVLVIEDERDVRNLLAHYLEGLHCTVRMADSGEAGLELALDDPPDLVILDVRLPHMDGHDVARALHADPRTSHCKLVITSVLDMEDICDIESDGILHKPFRRADVERIVNLLREGR